MKMIITLIIFAIMMVTLGGCGATQSSASSEGPTDVSDLMVDRQTGSVGHIEVSDLDRAGYTSFEEYVASHTAGVDIDEFGNLVIRGMSVDKGYAKPLILYDGNEVFDTSTINPNDIASIDVIKDAASTAIYGMRGASGVIVVTSKAKAARSDKSSDKKDNVKVEINSKVSTKLK